MAADDVPQSFSSDVNPHDVQRYADAIQDRERRQASLYGERNFVSNRAHNVSGAGGTLGALQLRRLSGVAKLSSIVVA